MYLDPIRLRILKLVDQRGSNLKQVSLALGKNAAYAHQYIYRGTPKVLPDPKMGARTKPKTSMATVVHTKVRP